jgi:RNA polymerase sigma-70 factor (ECF subfamily)
MERTSPDDLSALMKAAQAGDTAAYERLLHTIVPRVRQVVRRQRAFAGREDIEDLVQDVLLSVHAARATYDAGRPFMPWLSAIVRNRLADAARRYARHASHEIQVDDMDVTFADEATKSPMEAYSRIDALTSAIRSLPAAQRRAIELLKLQGRSLKEASAHTGTSVGALKVATHRAMAALRKALS